MDVTSGGKLILRLVASEAAHVEYVGELSAAGEPCNVRVRVGIAEGQVDVTVSGTGVAPQWLVGLTRATMRAAWRSNRAGIAWPRRLTRWRPSTGSEQEP